MMNRNYYSNNKVRTEMAIVFFLAGLRPIAEVKATMNPRATENDVAVAVASYRECRGRMNVENDIARARASCAVHA